jgi:anti-sigma factor RsiW
MNSMQGHYSDGQLYRVIDGEATGDERGEVDRHLTLCSRCRAQYDALVRFDRLIARMPLSTVGPLFTETILAKAGLKPLSASSSRLIEFAMGTFGLLLLGAVTVAILAVGGVFEPLSGTGSTGSSSPVFGIVGTAVTQASVYLGKLLKEFFPFLTGVTSVWTSLGALGAILLLLVLEPAFGRTFAERKR